MLFVTRRALAYSSLPALILGAIWFFQSRSAEEYREDESDGSYAEVAEGAQPGTTRKSAIYPVGAAPPPAHMSLEYAEYSRSDAIIEEFSIEKAAAFIDEAAVKWGRKHGCVTCHTNGYYLIAPNEIFQHRPAALEVREFAEQFVDSWYHEGLPDVEIVVATAAFLAINNMQTEGELRPATIEALEEAWAQQSEEGHWAEWLKCNWPPFEQDDHYGPTLLAIAMGMAPASYIEIEPARSGIARLLRYLKTHPAQEIHHKAMMLWASAYHADLVNTDQSNQWIDEIMALQRSDGGWASGSLGVWRQLQGRPSDPPVGIESDGYGTGFIVFVLREAGVPASDPSIQDGIAWLKTHQQIDGKWFTQSLRNEPDTSNFLTHTGTTFALKALIAGDLAGNPDYSHFKE